MSISPYTFVSYTAEHDVGTYLFNLTLLSPTSSANVLTYASVQYEVSEFEILFNGTGATNKSVPFYLSPHIGTNITYEWMWDEEDSDR